MVNSFTIATLLILERMDNFSIFFHTGCIPIIPILYIWKKHTTKRRLQCRNVKELISSEFFWLLFGKDKTNTIICFV